jgi:D-3-phosphoglycerate dehydrogenase
MLDAPRLALMKRTAYVVNVARGPIIDQLALTQALKEGRLAGAALDVLEPEPIAPDDPLLELENVILTPHAIGMTDEMLAGTGKSASESVLAVSSGQLPRYIANPDVLDHPRIRERMNG